jgi:hypothetical protein
MTALGWRGILALHVLAYDLTTLCTNSAPNLLPSALRGHYWTVPLSTALSFFSLGLGLEELLHAGSGWLGQPIEIPPSAVAHEGYISFIFLTLSIIAMGSIVFSQTAERAKVCS